MSVSVRQKRWYYNAAAAVRLSYGALPSFPKHVFQAGQTLDILDFTGKSHDPLHMPDGVSEHLTSPNCLSSCLLGWNQLSKKQSA